LLLFTCCNSLLLPVYYSDALLSTMQLTLAIICEAKSKVNTV
jgi:hypothetical protein